MPRESAGSAKANPSLDHMQVSGIDTRYLHVVPHLVEDRVRVYDILDDNVQVTTLENSKDSACSLILCSLSYLRSCFRFLALHQALGP